MLTALVMLNRIQIRNASAPIPDLYSSGVRYKREARYPNGRRREDWRTIGETLQEGVGDCEDLAGYRVAQLQERGVRAIPWVTRHGSTWHVRVRYPNGQIEDPSALLGMKVPEGVKL